MRAFLNLPKRLFAAVSVLFLLFSCSRDAVTFVGREKLFSLDYGRFENEIDLFQLDFGSNGPDTQIFMKDGMFYITNSGGKKILQLTSFGDLLSVFYNPEHNPEPSFARSVDADSAQIESADSTRKAISYPFNHPVFLCVDNLKRLSVVDQVPPERMEYDSVSQVALKNVVLRFSSDGKFLDWIGQEGPGGSPFPPVAALHTNNKNELIVLSRSQNSLIVYWYSVDGNLLFRVPVSYRNLPGPYDSQSQVFSSLEKIVPSFTDRTLYLKIDYYIPVIDQSTGANAGISFDKSCVYPFLIDEGAYGSRIDLPAYTEVEQGKLGTTQFRKPYELLGVTASGWFFLSTPSSDGYTIEMMDVKSGRIISRTLQIQNEELAYNAMALSPDGILSALLATPWQSSVVWWRTDALIGEIRR
ncbi:hypothetical protein K7J14_07480 [Treponema zuelzerae]|uniref:Lipoprotein n=1 Tax=Teretinema zuelzerae TaxID=156 RepID=A0AAE3EIT9_9SPIR|nr:hypothetical protein [Teretinema zuelzerae]MCD1654546.1 hypothetical protein [Teretinema zuelzerae]